ncbi:MAG TPA: Nramp family divalent metal transporter [Patescibacteria group bacterium]|nr:Nramp family divalent metal transporter [Patescibacteria group bacterium]
MGRTPKESDSVSLSEYHKTVEIPKNISFLRKLLAFSGPGFLVAVGYMDPGNWATDIAAGSAFYYKLLSVILISNIFAMILQHLALKLGIVTGLDLAQICRRNFPRPVTYFLWAMAEIMIIACDLAEVIGSAIALNLLFKIPLLFGVLITAFDVVVLLAMLSRGVRLLEALVIGLIATVTLSFGFEIVFSRPDIMPLLQGFVPSVEIVKNPAMLYVAVGILGATVMPHNLYLHSSVVQTRNYGKTPGKKREAIKFATIDSTLALFLAFFVNAAILIVAAAVFYTNGLNHVFDIGQAYKLLSPLVGVGAASILFALALLASGQNSTITGTLAGQIIMEGFLKIKIKPFLRRLITRSLAIIPAVLVIVLYGANSLGSLLVLSQVILSIQLSFAVFPLIFFTGNKRQMGEFVNSTILKVISGVIALIIAALNIWLVANFIF